MLLLSACKPTPPAPPHIFALNTLQDTQTIQLPSGQTAQLKEEYFVIENPPSDKQAFLRLVQQYNAQTVSAEKLGQQFALLRMFYRANEKLNRQYKEDRRGYFDKEQIGNHVDDLLLVVKFRQDSKEVEYLFETTRPAYQALFGAQ